MRFPGGAALHCWGGGAAETASSEKADGSLVTKVKPFYNSVDIRKTQMQSSISGETQLRRRTNAMTSTKVPDINFLMDPFRTSNQSWQSSPDSSGSCNSTTLAG